MSLLRTYLKEMAAIGASGEATKETSYYPPLLNLLNAVGATISPNVLCVLTPKNIGDGIPDGGLFVKRPAVVQAGGKAMETRAPERGVVEVKGLAASVKETAGSQQVAKYLSRYGQVLVTNYREFLPMRLWSDGVAVKGEPFALAASPEAFWAMAKAGNPPAELETVSRSSCAAGY